MKKSYLNHMILGIIAACSHAHAEPTNPFNRPLNVWGTQIEGFDMQIQRKYIPEYTKNRYGEREIIGISRIDVRLVNLSNQYKCGIVTIKDNDRPNLYLGNYTNSRVLLKPKETKNIGYFEPENTEDINFNYNLKRIDVVENAGTYLCKTESTPPTTTSNGGNDDLDDCYITTAMCRDTGKADDCLELQALRQYRDDVMLETEQGRALVKDYYHKAPKIVSRINQEQQHERIYRDLREQYIQPAAQAALNGQNDLALKLYKEMVDTLAKKYL